MQNETGLFIPLLHEMEVLADFSTHPSYVGVGLAIAPTAPMHEWHDIQKILKHPQCRFYHAWYRHSGLRAITDGLAHTHIAKAQRFGILTLEQKQRAAELKLL